MHLSYPQQLVCFLLPEARCVLASQSKASRGNARDVRFAEDKDGMAALANVGHYSDALVVLGIAGVVVPLLSRFGMSPVLGYLGMGAALGPFGWARFGAIWGFSIGLQFRRQGRCRHRRTRCGFSSVHDWLGAFLWPAPGDAPAGFRPGELASRGIDGRACGPCRAFWR